MGNVNPRPDYLSTMIVSLIVLLVIICHWIFIMLFSSMLLLSLVLFGIENQNLFNTLLFWFRSGPLTTQSSLPFYVVSSTKVCSNLLGENLLVFRTYFNNVFVMQVNATIKKRPQALDSLFANMKEKRMRAQQAQIGGRHTSYVIQQKNFVGPQRNFFGYQRNFMG